MDNTLKNGSYKVSLWIFSTTHQKRKKMKKKKNQSWPKHVCAIKQCDLIVFTDITLLWISFNSTHFAVNLRSHWRKSGKKTKKYKKVHLNKIAVNHVPGCLCSLHSRSHFQFGTIYNKTNRYISLHSCQDGWGENRDHHHIHMKLAISFIFMNFWRIT